MSDIFISYARENRDVIQKLASVLEREGYSVWWDRQLVSGMDFSEEIERELQAAKVVIAAWSSHAVKSPWVKDEAMAAREAGKLAPITLDGLQAPLGFRQYHVINFEGWQGAADALVVKNLVRAVESHIGCDRPRAPIAHDSKTFRIGLPTKMIAGILGAAIITIVTIFILFLRISATTENIDVASSNYRTIAVLPFDDMSEAGDQSYFSEGISEELLNRLAQVEGLHVAARTSSAAAKSDLRDAQAIGAALNVETILEGSVRRSGDQLRITAQLIDTKSGYNLWSETYNRELIDIFDIQDEISTKISEWLTGVIFNIENVPSKPSYELQQEFSANDRSEIYQPTPEQFDQLLFARAKIRDRNLSDMKDARDKLEKLVVEAPGYVDALANLAKVTLLLSDGMHHYGHTPYSQAQPIARQLAERAIAINPDSAIGNAVMGLTYNYSSEGTKFLVKSLELNPADTEARNWLAASYEFAGRPDKRLVEMQKINEIDPMWSLGVANMANALFRSGRDDEARRFFKRYELLFGKPNGWESWFEFISGNHATSIKDMALESDLGQNPARQIRIAMTLKHIGELEQALQELNDLPARWSFMLSFYQGEPLACLDQLEMKSLVTSPAEIIQILHTYSPCAARAQAPDRIIKYYESNFGSPEAVYKVASRVAPQFLSQTAAAYLMKNDYVKAKALIEAAADQISELKSHGWASREFTMAEARISLFRGERADAINLYRQSLLIYGGEYSAPDWPVDDFMPRAINDAQLIFTLQNDLIEHINQDRSSLNWPTLSQ